MPSTSTNEWANWLNHTINARGWSVARLSRDSGLSTSTIFRWLSGESRSVNTDAIRAISEAMAQLAGQPLDGILAAAALAAVGLPPDIQPAVVPQPATAEPAARRTHSRRRRASQ